MSRKKHVRCSSNITRYVDKVEKSHQKIFKEIAYPTKQCDEGSVGFYVHGSFVTSDFLVLNFVPAPDFREARNG